MKAETVQALIEINQRFYGEFAGAFASTRRRIQPGVERVLADLPDTGAWLDLGCGSGWLAVEWLRRGRRSAYLGLDFSEELLNVAQNQLAEELDAVGEQIRFQVANLSEKGWDAGLGSEKFAGGLCFAVLHHLPGAARRLAFLCAVAQCIQSDGLLALSVWQFQHSPRLWQRRLPWEQAGLAEEELEPGDTLLDWRHAQPGQEKKTALRYVHLFSGEELCGLAEASGFQVEDQFESDGDGGRLGLYQLWRRKPVI